MMLSLIHISLIDENEYGIKYDIPHAHMFVIEGMEKVRAVSSTHLTDAFIFTPVTP